jgi:hypothetical protein
MFTIMRPSELVVAKSAWPPRPVYGPSIQIATLTLHLATAIHQLAANMASYAISSSMILVIHDNMINGTNHIV